MSIGFFLPESWREVKKSLTVALARRDMGGLSERSRLGMGG